MAPGWRTCDDSWLEIRRVESRGNSGENQGSIDLIGWSTIRTELAVSRSTVVPWKASNSQALSGLVPCSSPGDARELQGTAVGSHPSPSYSFFFFRSWQRACTAAKRPPCAISPRSPLSSPTDYSVQSTPYVAYINWTDSLRSLPSALDPFPWCPPSLPRARACLGGAKLEHFLALSLRTSDNFPSVSCSPDTVLLLPGRSLCFFFLTFFFLALCFLTQYFLLPFFLSCFK